MRAKGDKGISHNGSQFILFKGMVWKVVWIVLWMEVVVWRARRDPCLALKILTPFKTKNLFFFSKLIDLLENLAIFL